LGGILCLVAATTLRMTIPWLYNEAGAAITAGACVRTLAGYPGLIVALAVGFGAVRTFSRLVIFSVRPAIEYALRNDLLAHLETLPLALYQPRHTGDLMTRLVNDVTAVRMLLGPGILNFINTPVYYVSGLAIMLSIEARLSIAALAVYPMALLIVKRTSRLLMERTLRVQEGLAELSTRVQQTLAGIHVVKAYASERHERHLFADVNRRFQEHNLRLARPRGVVLPVVSLVGGVGLLVVLWFGGALR